MTDSDTRARSDQLPSFEPCVPFGRLIIGPIRNNVYVLDCGGELVIVDPTAHADRIVEYCEQTFPGVPITLIVLTHRHYDHAGAAADLRELTGAKVLASEAERDAIESGFQETGVLKSAKPCPVDYPIGDGDIVEIGKTAWKVLVTPGHTKGSICLFVAPQCAPNPKGLPVLISGDTLFRASCGRTDFESGSEEDMRASLFRLAKLPDETLVLPGHEDLTFIGDERTRVFAVWGGV